MFGLLSSGTGLDEHGPYASGPDLVELVDDAPGAHGVRQAGPAIEALGGLAVVAPDPAVPHGEPLEGLGDALVVGGGLRSHDQRGAGEDAAHAESRRCEAEDRLDEWRFERRGHRVAGLRRRDEGRVVVGVDVADPGDDDEDDEEEDDDADDGEVDDDYASWAAGR